MRYFFALTIIVAYMFGSPPVFARGGGGHSGGHSATLALVFFLCVR